MPNAFWFTHDSNARYDPKIQLLLSKYKAEGYGWFWIFIEKMRVQADYKLPVNDEYINVYAKECYTKPQKIKEFLENCVDVFKLFEKSENYIYSNSLNRRLEIINKRSQSARKSAKSRWDNTPKPLQTQSDGNAIAMQTQSDGNAIAMQTQSDGNAKEIKKEINNIYTPKGGANAPEKVVKTLIELKNELEKSPNKVGYLGKIFQEYHKTAPSNEIGHCYDRLGKMVKEHNNDHARILSAIFKTQDGMAVIDGSHLDYIYGVLRKNGQHSEESIKETGIRPGW